MSFPGFGSDSAQKNVSKLPQLEKMEFGEATPYSPPSQPVVTYNAPVDSEEEKYTKNTKWMLFLSIIPPIGCVSWVYNRWVHRAAEETDRFKYSHWSLIISSIMCLVIAIIILWYVFAILFWVFLGILIVVLLAMIFIPKFRAWVLKSASSARQQTTATAATLGATAGQAATNAAVNYAKNNPDQVYDMAKASYTQQNAYKA
eukprot:GDKJ01030094.1.p1 GENE.GDKJ01030094.1~~GDKJ01030094.1.p1  ORF type:complete len:202 (-),score=36.58 GDKJ01030094.1:91-696(-)